MENKKIIIDDKKLVCGFCKNEEFDTFDVNMNGKWAVPFDVERASKSGRTYVCTSCGFAHTFYREKPFITTKDKANDE